MLLFLNCIPTFPALEAFGQACGWIFSPLVAILAFGGLLYNIRTTKKQFHRQSRDSVFYRLFSDRQRYIESCRIEGDDQPVCNTQRIFKFLCSEIYKQFDSPCTKLGMDEFSRNFRTIDNAHFEELYRVSDSNYDGDGSTIWHTAVLERHKNSDVIDIEKFKSEYFRNQSVHGEKGISSVFRRIGAERFYTLALAERQAVYGKAVCEVMEAHLDFIDLYTQQLGYILEFIDNSSPSERTTYESYLNSQLSGYELLLLFYLVAGKRVSGVFPKQLGKYVKFCRLSLARDRIIGNPQEQVIAKEYDQIFAGLYQ